VAELDDDDFTFESAADNPAVAAAAEALTQQDEAPELRNPLDGPVTLPAGYRRIRTTDSGTSVDEVRKAWVRELNGEDEEKIAKVRTKDEFGNLFISTILECGLQRLGEEAPDKDDINSLVMGDQQFLLTEIARATYGDEIEYEKVRCLNCGEEFDVALSIKDDLPVKRLDSVDDADFEVKLTKDRVAEVTLPTVEISALTTKAETDAEVNTILIANCVQRIRGPKGDVTVAGDTSAARRLGLVDRRRIVEEMGKRMPGPQFSDVRFKHEPGCGEEIRLGVSLVDLFRGL
jgi:hypothetical protein